tara:strand:- start:995 stop:1141 length:147 start_codon:yes stop_codon:yes gene_type:complete
MIKKPSGMTILLTVMGIALVASFDYAMKVDADNLCSSDATAYAECADR